MNSAFYIITAIAYRLTSGCVFEVDHFGVWWIMPLITERSLSAEEEVNNHHIVLIKTGLGRAIPKIKLAQHVNESSLMSGFAKPYSLHSPELIYSTTLSCIKKRPLLLSIYKSSLIRGTSSSKLGIIARQQD